MPAPPQLDDPNRGQFHGGVVNRRPVGGAVMVLTEPTAQASASKERHYHQHPYFWVLLEGDCMERIERRIERVYRPYVPTFHPAGEVHSHHRGDAAPSGFGIVLTEELVERAEQFALLPSEPSELHGSEFSVLIRRIVREFRSDDPASNLALEGLCLELIAYSSRSNLPKADRRPPRWLLQARELLEDSWHESVSLTSVAQTVGIHPVHLSSEFRRHFRCTVGDYVRARRIEEAKRFLAAGEISGAEIAAQCGFCDESHFCRTFRALTGMTPSEYRILSEP